MGERQLIILRVRSSPCTLSQYKEGAGSEFVIALKLSHFVRSANIGYVYMLRMGMFAPHLCWTTLGDSHCCCC